MIKRVLVLASVASMIDQFNIPNIRLLQDMGYFVDVACDFRDRSFCSDEKIRKLKEKLKKMGVQYYQIDFSRDITQIVQNMKALWQAESLLRENEYIFLHCHSPIGGVIGRLAGKLTKTKVIYTAHGFHFYKGAPKKNWLIYYPVEMICSYMTDVLITINKEDYAQAKKMKAKKVVFLPGVGIDLELFGAQTTNVNKKRQELGIPENSLWILAVGELNKNKNHENLIRAIAKIDCVYLTIAGKGALQEYLMDRMEELGVSDRVSLLGYRSDISALCESCDLFAFPSLREGLPMAMMEAMASGKPIVCSKIRGNTDLLIEEKGGFYFDPLNVDDIGASINKILTLDLQRLGEYNRQKVKQYELKKVMEKSRKIYQYCGEQDRNKNKG